MKYFVKIFIVAVSLFSAFAVSAQGTAGVPVYNVINAFEDIIIDSPVPQVVSGNVKSPATAQPTPSAVTAAGSAPAYQALLSMR